MTTSIIDELALFGQSIWLDNISRSLIEDGTLKKLIDAGLRGVTSNPTIFDKAIRNSNIYDKKIETFCKKGKSSFEIYDDLTVDDIQDTCDIFMPVYKKTNGLDGYVSLEVNPKLADQTEKTIEEGRRLSKKVNRPNVMFKVPSTPAGFGAVEGLIADGINVNVTLIFSVGQYIDTVHAYMNGLKRLLEKGGDLSKVHSVASVFVSRIDTIIDKILGEKNPGLKGKAAVANSKMIYKKFLDTASSNEFKELSKKNANPQRVLWGSTSTKNPEYSDIKYVEELIAKNTVNTVPDETLYAFMDHGKVKEAVTWDVKDAEKILSDLREAGVDINSVCEKLLKNGVIAFENSFDNLINAFELKRKKLCEI